jgi:hypothetical protein
MDRRPIMRLMFSGFLLTLLAVVIWYFLLD